MLRACHDVLRPGGRIVGFTIHTSAGLDRDEIVRAEELGPSQVGAESSPSGLLRTAGFEVLLEEDVTEAFEATVAAIFRARQEWEHELRAEEGDELFEEEQQKKIHMLEGVSSGLLLRSLHLAAKP